MGGHRGARQDPQDSRGKDQAGIHQVHRRREVHSEIRRGRLLDAGRNPEQGGGLMAAPRELYTFFRSSTSFRLRIALAYKGLPYEPRYISLPKMEHRDPAYLAVNPQGLLPLLVDDGHGYIQSMAIIEYLDE